MQLHFRAAFPTPFCFQNFFLQYAACIHSATTSSTTAPRLTRLDTGARVSFIDIIGDRERDLDRLSDRERDLDRLSDRERNRLRVLGDRLGDLGESSELGDVGEYDLLSRGEPFPELFRSDCASEVEIDACDEEEDEDEELEGIIPAADSVASVRITISSTRAFFAKGPCTREDEEEDDDEDEDEEEEEEEEE